MLLDTDKLAVIKRDKETKTARLELRGQGNWRVFAGPDPGGIDYTRPLLSGMEGGVYPLPVAEGRRSYFALEVEGAAAPERMILAERLLPMAGGYNFRDLGGVRNRHGQSTAWGLLFRTDDMMNLTDADLGYLAALPLRSVVDFRTGREREAYPDRLPDSVRDYYPYSVTPGSVTRESFRERGAGSIMLEMYRHMVSDPEVVAVYRDFFALVQNPEKLPLSFHCSAGKDRTGMAAALIYFALGVDKGVIMEDYLASAAYLAGKYPDPSDIFQVRPEFLETALESVDELYGSVENYLTGPLGVDLELMRELYLA